MASVDMLTHASEYITRTARQAAGNVPGKDSKDEGTVVRWSAAYGLTEIAKNNPATRSRLMPFFEERTVNESENGVRNVYVKALKTLAKETG